MSMLTWAAIIIVLYTILNLWVGLGVGYKKDVVSKASGYFLGGGTNYFILYFTTAATWFSTWLYMGAVGTYFKFGIGFICSATWQLVIMVLMGYFGIKFAKLKAAKDYITPADLLEDFYESKQLRSVVAFLQLVFCIPYLMAQVTGVGLAFSTLTGGYVPYWGGVLYSAVVVGLYCTIGGFRSQAWVDTLQGIMFTVILWGAVAILIIQPEIGGFADLFEKVGLKNMKLLKYPLAKSEGYHLWTVYLSFFFIQSFGGFFAPYVWQRMYAAKSPSIIRKMSGTMAPFYCLVISLPVMIIGFCGVLLYPDIANTDNVMVATLTKYAPIWGIFAVVGILAAGMSTISSILVTASSIIAVDVIKPFKPDMGDHTLRNLGRYLVLALLIVAVVLSLMQVKGLVWLVFMSLSGFAQLFFPALGVFYWKRASTQGCIAGLVTGMVVTYLFSFTYPNPLDILGGFWGLMCNGVVFYVVSIMTRPASEQKRAEFRSIVEA